MEVWRPSLQLVPSSNAWGRALAFTGASMKRFWSVAHVVPVDGQYAVQLDGKPMRLPGGPTLVLPQAALAEAIAEEWQDAPAQMRPEDVPLTRIAGTAQERVAKDPGASVAALAAYGETDLLCYRAGEPEALVIRQHHAWQPWLDWAAAAYGARLRWTQGVMPLAQDEAAIAALRDAVARYDAFALAGLGIVVPALGSLVLGIAVAAGRLDVAAAHRLSILDELFEEERWGLDADAAARRAHVARDMKDAARFMALAASAWVGQKQGE
jgi:chaperone required for assembly of F1-ATPase